MKTIEIKLSEIEVDHKVNYRKDYGTEKFESLKETIQEHGIQKPLDVYEKNGKYHLWDGFRRHKAALELVEETRIIEPNVICVVSDIKDNVELIIRTLLSNERKEFSAIEESLLIGDLISLSGKSMKEVAMTIGKSLSYVSKCVTISNADDVVTDAAKSKLINVNEAATISRNDVETQKETVKKIKEKPEQKEAIIKSVSKKATKPQKENVPSFELNGEPKDNEALKVVFEDIGDDADIDDEIESLIAVNSSKKVVGKNLVNGVNQKENFANVDVDMVSFLSKLRIESESYSVTGKCLARIINMISNCHKKGETVKKTVLNCIEILNDF